MKQPRQHVAGFFNRPKKRLDFKSCGPDVQRFFHSPKNA